MRLLGFFIALLLLTPLAGALGLSADERAWLAAHRPLRVGVVLEAPYAQLDNRSHQLSGASIDLMNAVADQLQTQLAWQVYPDRAALEVAARDGKLDLAPGLAQTPGGLLTWVFSDPYLRIPSKVVSRYEPNGAVDLEQLPLTERIAVRSPSAVAKFLAANYPVLERLPVTSERAALQKLQAGEADYAVVDEAQLNILLREPDFAHLNVVGDTGYTLLLRVAVRKEERSLVYLVDRALNAMPERNLAQLYERWVLPNYPRLTDTLAFWRKFALFLALLAGGFTAAWLWSQRQRHEVEARLAAARHELDEKAQTEAALRMTQFSVDLSTVGILWLNWDGRVRYANQAAQAMLGFPGVALIDEPLSRIEPNMDMDRWLALWGRVRSESMASFETDLVKADGQTVPVEATFSFLRLDRNQAQVQAQAEYLVAYLTDVTDKRLARTMLRELSAHLESVREEEKARIAREVHDELGQVLTALRLETSMCELSLQGEREQVEARLRAMKKLIEQTFTIVRDVASALRPPILDAGLGSAVEWQARRFESRTQIPCLVHVPEAPLQLADNKAIGLFRILQEALTNVMRHAEAHTVAISLAVREGELELTIADDGKGFEPNLDRRGSSYGLIGIRERVLMLGGRLNIHSEPGEGATLSVAVPLDDNEGMKS
jgi:PAS domain S-box-containing protein